MENDILAEAIGDLESGSAICFTGAGFSYGATDAQTRKIPSSDELCAEICQLVGEEYVLGTSLTDIADFCESSSERKAHLTNFVVTRLTKCRPSESHIKIMGMPWRAVFTTNFDDVAEVAAGTHKLFPVTPTTSAKVLSVDKTPIYYLHGRALDVLEGQASPGIVLSERNYLDLKERNRDLYAALENEIHAASRIFFVGYSLKDAEIASRIFNISGIAEKSIVVVGPNGNPISLSRLAKFGTVLPIGVDSFASELPAISPQWFARRSIDRLTYLDEVLPEPARSEITVDDVERLLLSGKFDYGAYAHQRNSSVENSDYCIYRSSAVAEVFDRAAAGTNRIIASSDLGNGKSMFLSQVAFEGHKRGFRVFKIETLLKETFSEVDLLLKDASKKIFLIDGMVRFKQVAIYIGKRLAGNCILVVSEGTRSEESNYGRVIDTLSGKVHEVDLNVLSSSELANWNSFLERWGFWENRIEDSTSQRIDFLRRSCGAEVRAIVLSVFKESRLSVKIMGIVEYFLRQNSPQSKAFIALIINALCHEHVDWGRIVEWLNIDVASLRSAIRASPASNFMDASRNWHNFTSAQLADFILSNYDFPLDDVVDAYTKIVRHTAYAANDSRSGFDSVENLKELVRFRFVTRLFSSMENGLATITAVYQRLSSVPRMRDNDQFWLQYAMARMEERDYESAETYLGTALGIAKEKASRFTYSNHQLIDQRARLRFMTNAQLKKKINKKELLEAIDDLTSALVKAGSFVVHPLRSVQHILHFVEMRGEDLEVDLKDRLYELLKLMKTSFPDGKLEKSQRGETEMIRKDLKSAILVVSNL